MEKKTQIDDHVLTEAQAIAVRVAITSFYEECSVNGEFREGLGPIADAYRDRLGEVLRIILTAAKGS